MRSIIPIIAVTLGLACLAAPAAILSSHSALAQADQSGPPKQIALTAAQIENLIAAKKDMDAIVNKLPQQQSDQPDPKVMAQLDAVAKKHKFASYAEYDDVSANVGMVLDGFDPQTQKYVGAEVVLKKQIAEVQADKKMSAKDKKDALDQLREQLKSVTPIQFPGNIALVTKYYDKLSQIMQDDQGSPDGQNSQ